ncbi:MAG TPA: cytochrome B [Flavobacteriales bacterium]|nr:cytochrome B [Flavobacteriales bacterium]
MFTSALTLNKRIVLIESDWLRTFGGAINFGNPMDIFYNILKHTHGGLRWLLMIVMIVAIFKFFTGWSKNRVFEASDKKLALIALILVHLQLVFGLILYFLSPYPQMLAQNAKEVMANGELRFFAVEHLIGMLVAIALITVGYSRAKKLKHDFKKFKVLLITYLLSFLLIMALIPWDRISN